MAIKIKRNGLIRFPSYRWDGSSKDWTDVPIGRAFAAELPVAYFTSQIVSLGGTVFFVGANANRPGYVPRRVNVLLCSRSRYDSLITNEAFVEMANEQGLIVASITSMPAPKPIGGGGEYGEALRGLPVVDGVPKQPGTFIGGRLLILNDDLKVLLEYADYYFEYEEVEYSAPPASHEWCLATLPHALGAGGSALPDSYVYPYPTNYTLNGYRETKIQNVKEYVAKVGQNFDRLLLVLNSAPLFTQEEVWTSSYVCKVPNPLLLPPLDVDDLVKVTIQPVFDGWEGPTLTVNNSVQVANENAYRDAVGGMMEGEGIGYRLITGSEIIAFFEED